MLSAVLNSPRAVEVSVAVVRTFIKLRQILATHLELAERLGELERKYDGQFTVVFDALRELMAEPDEPRSRIGFAPSDDQVVDSTQMSRET